MAKTSLHTHTAVVRLPGVSWAFLYVLWRRVIVGNITVVFRCHSVYLVGWISAVLGWRPTQVICTDKSWSFRCEL